MYSSYNPNPNPFPPALPSQVPVSGDTRYVIPDPSASSISNKKAGIPLPFPQGVRNGRESRLLKGSPGWRGEGGSAGRRHLRIPMG